MTRRLLAGCILLGLPVIIACVPTPERDDDNAPPVARLFAPQLAQAGAVAQFDARDSDDRDDDALTFALNPGDGGPSANSPDGVFTHVFESPGTFEVELTVTDAADAIAQAVVDVVVVSDDASCTCDPGCFGDGACTPRGCEQFATSAEDDDPLLPADALDCPAD